MLIIVPQCGLCNRLRVLLSGLAIHDRTGCRTLVEWERSAECFAWYEELFLPISEANFRVEHRRWWARPITRRNLHWPAFARMAMRYTCQRANFIPSGNGEVEKLLDAHRNVYISTPYALCDYPPRLAALLQPQPHLQARIDELKSRFTRYTVGVHIRRTDNVKSLSESPVEAFRRAMNHEIQENFNTRFYLATDDESLKRTLVQQYSDRIITQRTNVRRDTLAGMEEAVVDLWCLAATQKLLGSYWSSFTDMAAELGGIHPEIVRR